ncbi:gamma-D-glutamyl-{L}-meso-diaminopimelate peptidase I . Metallo peptidase. MEROPS family M14C [Sporobacter termitidis DSM 10068]|uniref:Gamma-D-glutamyl-(L)-meso-diaminopimelate peptidase I. Metallo peptidase. MEROPS family M14C n=1 Tax=Sporobacter termitidis DSM 10068 TaxID=1123282 RepID=A0A1M5YA39_9FIRM|nr:M14 family metallocarboxypeptidase [Sporobacter termitidis]SHI08373.1 gamma-D-glutamyl-{L}-meso-diaminopimelate peptidase I . Metallo peptidase. MEROPS family M14C [Sporobacter termitidis DSM 10068]
MENLHKSGPDIVPEDLVVTSGALDGCLCRLASRYPFLRLYTAGRSVLGRALTAVELGRGPKELFYNASHHANEWITSLILLRFIEDYARAVDAGGSFCGADARALFETVTLTALPLVNPDGADLVNGALPDGTLESARGLAANNPEVPFPDGWKANIRGVDLNLQYPAGWENARDTKASMGVTKPGPRDFPGPSPLSEPESRAVYDLTRAHDFLLTISLHTQGKVIYWKYLDYEPKNSYGIAENFGALSSYDVEETPIASGYAGYKDWFIADYNRPGYTIEAGEGASPLPLCQFPEIYGDCLSILGYGLAVAGGL